MEMSSGTRRFTALRARIAPMAIWSYYGEGVFVGYRYYDKRQVEPLFAFGHGLSYTTFEYANMRIPAKVAAGQPIEVSVDVRNSGHREGQETVQLYVGESATTEVVRPAKELKAFEKVRLAPGERKTVKFVLSARDLAYYDVASKGWTTTPGTYHLYVGSSSRDIRQQGDFESQAVVDARAPPADVRR